MSTIACLFVPSFASSASTDLGACSGGSRGSMNPDRKEDSTRFNLSNGEKLVQFVGSRI